MYYASQPIEILNLSNRTTNALRRNNIDTIGEFVKLTEEDILRISNLGAKSAKEVVDKIEAISVIFSDKPPEAVKMTAEEKKNDYIISGLIAERIPVSELSYLPSDAYTVLLLNGIEYVHQLNGISESELAQMPFSDEKTAHIIAEQYNLFLSVYSSTHSGEPDIQTLISLPEYRETVLSFIKNNDISLEKLNMSNRSYNQLKRNGYSFLSDIIFLSDTEIYSIKNIGAPGVAEIRSIINTYIDSNAERIKAVFRGEKGAMWADESIRKRIPELYCGREFSGFGFSEFRAELGLPTEFSDDRLKKIIGGLIADKKLKYVDFRCYRIYKSFFDFIAEADCLDAKTKEIVLKRFNEDADGKNTLVSLGREYGLTRQRILQIVDNAYINLIKERGKKLDADVFDEDYYRYFLETYKIEKADAVKWLGIEARIINYFKMRGSFGTQQLEKALDDKKLDTALRLKIKNYLNRNKLNCDGVYIEKKHHLIADFVIKKYCREDPEFKEFVEIYNRFLENEDVPAGDPLYVTENVIRTRENKMLSSGNFLWKHHRRIRYYDVDGRNYDELFEELNLGIYQNIEISTQKLIEEHPETMRKYDIRDCYELHNLLRRIKADRIYTGMTFGKMPNITFGTFDRTAALEQLLTELAPISAEDFTGVIHSEYGYSEDVILSDYLPPFRRYYRDGVYSTDHKEMSEENKALLLENLTEDFYFFDELKQKYSSLIKGADTDEINSYNLIPMGFSVFSGYVLRNYSSLEAYFTHLLTESDVTDIAPLRQRYGYVVSFSGILNGLKACYDIIEIEPDKIIRLKKLNESGITLETIYEFCDSVYDFVEDGCYFSMHSLIKDGFYSPLFEYGFSELFCSNLVMYDSRFSYGKMFSNIVLFKGFRDFSTSDFLYDIIQRNGVIDIYDLENEITKVYGGKVNDKSDLKYKVRGTDVFYDEILERFYANIKLYYREIGVEGD